MSERRFQVVDLDFIGGSMRINLAAPCIYCLSGMDWEKEGILPTFRGI